MTRDPDTPPSPEADHRPPVSGLPAATVGPFTCERRLAVMVERLPVCVIIHGAGRILCANQAAAALLGHGSSTALVGLPLESVLDWDPARSDGSRRILRQPDPSGRTATVEAFETDILFGDQPARELVLRELDDQDQVLETLRETQSVLVSITQSASDYIMSLDPLTGEILFLNRSTILGKSPADYQGVSLFDLIEPESVPTLRRCMDRAVETGETATCEVRFEHPEKGLRFFEASLFPVTKDGKVVTLTLNSRDLTERVLTEQALRSRNEELRVLVGQLPVILWTTDCQLMVTSCRGAGLRKWEVSPAEVVGHPLDTLLNQATPAAEAILHHRRALLGSVADFELSRHRHTFQLHVEPFRSGAGEIVGVVGVAFDISRRKHAERRVAESERLLSDSQRMTQIGSWQWDLTTGVRRWSEENYRIVGLPFSTSPPSPLEFLRRFVVPEDRLNTEQVMAQAIESGTTSSVEFRVRRTDGQLRTIWLKARTLRDPEGRAQRIVGSMQDITDKRQSESRLRAQLSEEATLAELSAALANVPSTANLDDVIRTALGRVRTQWSVARILVLLLEPDSGRLYCTHDCHCPPLPSRQQQLAPADAALATWLATAAHSHHLPETDPRPPAAAAGEFVTAGPDVESARHPATAAHALQRELADGLTLPLQVGGQTLGYLCLCGNRPREELGRSLVGLRVFSNLLANAIARRRSDDALRQAHQQLQHVTASVSDGLWSVRWSPTRGFHQAYCSPVVAKITGQSPDQLTRYPERWLDGVHEDDLCRVRAWTERLLRPAAPPQLTGQARLELEYRLALPEGTIRWIRDSVVVRYLPDQVLQLDGVLTDISDRKLAEQQARQHHEELAHAGRLSTMGELMASIAHEVNQPLYAITNYAGACRAKLDTTGADQIRTWIDQIGQQAERAASIIASISNYVRKGPRTATEMNVNEIVTDSVTLVELESRRLQIRIQLQLAESLPSLLGDRVQLLQVLVNLLRNAFDASGGLPLPQRVVTVETVAQAKGVLLRVTDRGRGLGTVDPDQLFEPFFTTKADGMGMGLAISRSIVEASGGRIWATPNSGPGATFHVRLPIASQPVTPDQD